MTADLPPADTLPKTTMTELKRYYLSLTVEQHTDADGRTYYKATERGVDPVGRGPSAPAAIAAYARRVSINHGDGYLAEDRTNAEVVDPAEVSEE